MLDFETELEKLLSREMEGLPQYEFAELAAAGNQFLAELGRKQSDASLQIEEIYDLVKEQHALIEAAERERQEKDRLMAAALGITDLIEYFRAYAEQSSDETLKAQAGSMWQNTAIILANCGVFRFGAAGEPLDPQIHTVKASVESSFPREYVTEVLQSGYASQNRILRKAAVVVSRGQQNADGACNAWYNADDAETKEASATDNELDNKDEDRELAGDTDGFYNADYNAGDNVSATDSEADGGSEQNNEEEETEAARDTGGFYNTGYNADDVTDRALEHCVPSENETMYDIPISEDILKENKEEPDDE